MGDSLPVIDRQTGPELWLGASAEVRSLAEAVHLELNRFIPEDFGYTVHLGSEKPTMGLSFEDGSQMGSIHPLEIEEHLSIEGQLGSKDWDEQRAIEMSGCQVWDRITEEAERIPATVLTTKALQRHCREDLKEWIKLKRRDRTKVFILMWRDEDFAEEEFESLEAFERDLYNILAVEYHVIAIVADGKPLPAKRIDQLKAGTLRMMKEHMPVSYARATGKFDVDAAPDGQEEIEDEL
jgi:hypothetical protein